MVVAELTLWVLVDVDVGGSVDRLPMFLQMLMWSCVDYTIVPCLLMGQKQ